MAMDDLAKSLTAEWTGKEYETGDLSKEIDRRVKEKVAEFAGKDKYEFGDLSKEIDRRVKDRVMEFTGNSEYKFGDLTREIMSRNKDRMKDFLGEEGMKNYRFGDLTKALGRKYTGDDDYKVRISASLLLYDMTFVVYCCTCSISNYRLSPSLVI